MWANDIACHSQNSSSQFMNFKSSTMSNDWTNICFYLYGSWRRGLGSRKRSLSPLPPPPHPHHHHHHHHQIIHFWSFKGVNFIVVLLVKWCVVFHFLIFFSFNNFVSWLYIRLCLGNRVPTFWGKMLTTLLAVCLFCGWFIVFVCLSLWCWRLDVDLIVSVPEFSYLLWLNSVFLLRWHSLLLHSKWMTTAGRCSCIFCTCIYHSVSSILHRQPRPY